MIARFLWLAVLLAVTAPAGAGERAADWLMRINDAARHQVGRFAVQCGHAELISRRGRVSQC